MTPGCFGRYDYFAPHQLLWAYEQSSFISADFKMLNMKFLLFDFYGCLDSELL